MPARASGALTFACLRAHLFLQQQEQLHKLMGHKFEQRKSE